MSYLELSQGKVSTIEQVYWKCLVMQNAAAVRHALDQIALGETERERFHDELPAANHLERWRTHT